MRKQVMRILLVALVAFLATTLWAVTVTGVFEPASLDVEHYEAGAGNTLLLVRLGLAVLTATLLLGTTFLVKSLLTRTIAVLASPAVLAAFWLSVTGIERTAPGYSESAFRDLKSKPAVK